MERNILGRTGLSVTAAGLGCGGFSRLGIEKGTENASRIVRSAYESGVNFFDTAAVYGTQSAVAEGLRGLPRESFVISSKFPYTAGADLRPAGDLETTLDQALRELGTDYIDVYSLHGVSPALYREARDRFYPELLKMRERGKLRHTGITEMFGADTRHEMLKLALADDLWDVIMTGYNMLNPSAAKTLLPATKTQRVGVICMFAVRRSLSDPEQLKLDVQKMLAAGQVDPDLVKLHDTLAFLTEDGHAASIMEAAYRFCRHTEGIDVTLTGTGDLRHLADNLLSLAMPPLPLDALSQLEAMFGGVDCVSGQQEFPAH